MRELNISTFIQVMQLGLKEHDTQFAAGTFLLEALNQPDERFDTYREDISDKKISMLVSRQRPVPDAIKQASLIPELAQAALDYYEDKVMKDMNPFRKDDVMNQLVKVITADKEIGDKKRDELLNLYNRGQEGRFLGEVFLYAVNRPNKPDNSVGFEDAPLIAEANYECPICHKKLVETVKNSPIKRYVITHIFPEGLSKEESKELAAIYPKPKDLEQADNLIALCDHCADDYLMNPIGEEYKKIYDIKRVLARNYKAKESVNAVDLEDYIRVVLDALAKVNDSVQLVPLEYEALHIDEKFEAKNFILKTETQIKVLQYYRYIESIFSESETNFDLIASEIKMCSQKLETSGMSQSDVIDYLSEWIRNKTNLGTESRPACNAVVAFFIQNCEVFHKNEISK